MWARKGPDPFVLTLPVTMPGRRRRRTRRNNREKNGAQTREQTNWINPRGNMMFGFPDRMITTLRFWEQNFPSWAAETFKIYSYRGTSVFDPRTAAGGTQPEGFDLFALVYSSYRVLSSRCKIEISSNSTGIAPMTLILAPLNADPTGASAANVVAFADNPYAKQKMFNPGGPPQSLSCRMTAARVFGSEMVNSDDNFASLVSTNPTNNFFWAVAMYITAALTATQPFALNVMIEYDVQFYDRFALSDTLVLMERLNAIRSKQIIPPDIPPIVVPTNPGIQAVAVYPTTLC